MPRLPLGYLSIQHQSVQRKLLGSKLVSNTNLPPAKHAPQQVVRLPESSCICLHLPASPSICPHLPPSPCNTTNKPP